MWIKKPAMAALLITVLTAALFLGFFLRGLSFHNTLVVSTEKESAARVPVAAAPAEPQRADPETAEPEPAEPEAAAPVPAETGILTLTEDVPTGESASRSLPGGETDALAFLNTAGQAELETIPGVGEVLAGRILQYRQETGGFTDLKELTEIEGIGEKTQEKIARYLTEELAK